MQEMYDDDDEEEEEEEEEKSEGSKVYLKLRPDEQH